MSTFLAEINEIPLRASEFLSDSPYYQLPKEVPYLGMGSSYFAPLAFKYMGINIFPELASEYFNYPAYGKKQELAVLISQSGESSEVLWCTQLFNHYLAITNNNISTLGAGPGAVKTIALLAGDEQYSSSKTYINTLLALFRGFGFDIETAVQLLSTRIRDYRKSGEEMAQIIYQKITMEKIHGIYITGSGPNIATAMEAALILSESTRLCFTGIPMAQYDHGPKETAAGSIVIHIISRGKAFERTKKLSQTISSSGALVMTVEEPDAREEFSVLHNIIPFNYAAAYLAEKLNISQTFSIGGKITRTSD